MQSTDQHTNKFMQESKKKKEPWFPQMSAARLIQRECPSFIQLRLAAQSTLKNGPADGHNL